MRCAQNLLGIQRKKGHRRGRKSPDVKGQQNKILFLSSRTP